MKGLLKYDSRFKRCIARAVTFVLLFMVADCDAPAQTPVGPGLDGGVVSVQSGHGGARGASAGGARLEYSARM